MLVVAIERAVPGETPPNSIASTLGYILINRDGPALQPGSRMEIEYDLWPALSKAEQFDHKNFRIAAYFEAGQASVTSLSWISIARVTWHPAPAL